MEQVDWGAIIAAVTAAVSGVGLYLRVSGKWSEWRLKREQARAALEDKRAEDEYARSSLLQERVDRIVDQRLDEQRERIEALELENATHQDRVNKLQQCVADLQQENAAYKHSISTMEDALTRAHAERANDAAKWRDTQENLERDIETLRGRIDSLESELDRKTTELEQVRADQRTYKDRLREMETANARLEASNEAFEKSNGQLANLVEQVLARVVPQPADPRAIE